MLKATVALTFIPLTHKSIKRYILKREYIMLYPSVDKQEGQDGPGLLTGVLRLL